MKRRICCFCEHWKSGGIESFLCNVLLHMDLSSIEVDIVAAQIGSSLFTASLEKRGVHFYELSGRQNDIFRNYSIFRKLLEQQRYDVVHLNLFHGLSLVYAQIARQAGVPVRIAHSHNTALRKSCTRKLKMCLHEWGKIRYGMDCTEQWACAEAAARFLFPEALLRERRVQFIPNGVDADRFCFEENIRGQVRRELEVEGSLVVGCIGRLCYQKNQSFLLDIFHRLLSREPNSRLLLVGEGDMGQELRQKAEKLGIDHKVVFYGPSRHVERLLWAMDIFVMPSRFEGLPVTSIEAQASGIPCLFSDAITQECRIGGRTRFLPLSLPASVWADAILQERDCGNRREGALAVRRAGFDVADVAHWIERFYLRSDSYG